MWISKRKGFDMQHFTVLNLTPNSLSIEQNYTNKLLTLGIKKNSFIYVNKLMFSYEKILWRKKRVGIWRLHSSATLLLCDSGKLVHSAKPLSFCAEWGVELLSSTYLHFLMWKLETPDIFFSNRNLKFPELKIYWKRLVF